VAFFCDQRDAQRVLTDPKSVYAMRAAEALERDLDRDVIRAMDATVYTGKDGTTAVTAATDGMLTVNATAGMTYDILLTIDSNFQGYEIGNEAPIQKFLVITEQEHEALMKEAELISRDFSARMVVDAGKMTQAMDLNLIVYGSKMASPMLTVNSTTRDCWAVASGAIKGQIGVRDVKWQPRNDRWDTDQLLAKSERGTVRMEGRRVQKVQTTAT